MMKVGFQYMGKAMLFEPEPDITTQELAEAVGFFMNIIGQKANVIKGDADAFFELLSDQAKRHFKGSG